MIYLIIYATLSTLLLALACGRLLSRINGDALAGRWIVRLEQDVQSRQEAINEWRMAANVLREDNKALACEAQYERARRRVILMAYWRRRQKRSSYPAWIVLGRVP